MKTRNPFVRVARSFRKHGVLSTAVMAYQVSMRTLPRFMMNVRVKWAKIRTGGVAVREVQGSRMRLDLSDEGISRELYFTGIHEANSTRQFKEELKPGMVILEVGANVGYYTLNATKCIGPDGYVVALEPSPVNLESLNENLQLNGVQNSVGVFPVAAGRREGTHSFYQMNKANLSSFVKREDYAVWPVSIVDVEVLRVDSLLHKENLNVDYFRMDVEGFEVDVVEGMVETLTGPTPPVGGFIEIHPLLLSDMGSSARSFVERMEELGYRIKTARYRGRSDTIVRSRDELFSHPLLEASGCWEAFFVRQNVIS